MTHSTEADDLLEHYLPACQALDLAMHGEYSGDPVSSIKKATAHYNEIRALCADTNSVADYVDKALPLLGAVKADKHILISLDDLKSLVAFATVFLKN